MAGIVSLSVALLDNYVGKSIEDICPLKFGKVGDAHNHSPISSAMCSS